MCIIGFLFLFNETATTEIYTLSLHDALPISVPVLPFRGRRVPVVPAGTEETRAAVAGQASAAAAEVEPPPARSEEHTSELQSRQYLVCRLLLEKKNTLILLCYAVLDKLTPPP